MTNDRELSDLNLTRRNVLSAGQRGLMDSTTGLERVIKVMN